MISPVKVCDLGAAKLPAARHKVIAKPPPIFFVDFCIRTLLSSTLERLFGAFHVVSAREPRFLTSLREKFAQDATASHETPSGLCLGPIPTEAATPWPHRMPAGRKDRSCKVPPEVYALTGAHSEVLPAEAVGQV